MCLVWRISLHRIGIAVFKGMPGVWFMDEEGYQQPDSQNIP